MGSMASVFVTVASILGAWTMASLFATPVLVLWLRSRTRVNARRSAELRRSAWMAAARGGSRREVEYQGLRWI
jgi:hypothetical protein